MEDFYKIECQSDDGSFFTYMYVKELSSVKKMLIDDADKFLEKGVVIDAKKSLRDIKSKGFAFFNIGNPLGYSKCFYVTKNNLF